MEHITGLLCFLIFLGQIIVINLLSHMDEKLKTSNLLLTVMANKMGANDQDVKDAQSKVIGNL
jgi:hypothetical protein